MLRNMLLNAPNTPIRQRSNSGASSTPSRQSRSRASQRAAGSRGSSPRVRSSDSPLPPSSPGSSLELQICGSAEKAGDIADFASIARIERVENPQGKTTLSSVDTDQASSTTSNDLKDNPPLKSPTDHNNPSENAVTQQQSGKELDKSNLHPQAKTPAGTNGSPAENNNHSTNGRLENGQDTPVSESGSSPPSCNGNHSDTDSVTTEPSRINPETLKMGMNNKLNGMGDVKDVSKSKVRKNGFVNGLEKVGDPQGEETGCGDGPAVDRSRQSADTKTPHSHLSHGAPHHSRGESDSGNGSQVDSPAGDTLNANHDVKKQQAVDGTTNNQPAAREQLSVEPCADKVTKPNCLSPKSPSSSKTGSSRKRRHSESLTDSRQSTPSSDSLLLHKCLWAGCEVSYPTCSLLRRHVSSAHTTEAGACQWSGCDNLERKRWALVSHVSVSMDAEVRVTARVCFLMESRCVL